MSAIVIRKNPVDKLNVMNPNKRIVFFFLKQTQVLKLRERYLAKLILNLLDSEK